MDRLGEGAVVRSPDKPSDADNANRDWTLRQEKQKTETKKEEEQPPKEPLYKQLMDMIQSMWRASTMAVDMADKVTKDGQQERAAQEIRQEDEPLVYAEPRIKR